MDFCNECGSKTHPDWVFCRSCGNPLESPEIEAVSAQPIATTNTPKVELISRGWDVVDIEATGEETEPTLPTDPLETDDIVTPLDADAVEVSVDDVTVVARPVEAEEPEADHGETSEVAGDSRPAVATVVAGQVSRDRWDHLRPHGQIPGVSDPSRAPAKISQIAVLMTALAALVSAALYLSLNIQLDRFAAGDISGEAVRDFRTVAAASLLVMAGLASISLITLVWWIIKARPLHRLRSGPAGWIAIAAWLGGGVLIGYLVLLEKVTVADELTANSLIVIGLGLLMLASLATIRTISRVEIRDRW